MNGKDLAELYPDVEESALEEMIDTPHGFATTYRVRMIIYEKDAGPESPEVWTDEPLFQGNSEAEMEVQANQTHRKFLTHLASEQ